MVGKVKFLLDDENKVLDNINNYIYMDRISSEEYCTIFLSK
jgi:hypothetical protein